MINWDTWKCRCSAISKMMSNSQSNPQLTEKQAQELDDLEKKLSLTPKQAERMAELNVKRENGKKIILSDTCIEYLMSEFVYRVYGKISVSKEMDIEYIQKGRLCEAESIELLSFVDEKVYQKNEERVENDFLSGIPDVYTGDSIYNAESCIDLKNIWDAPLFFYQINKTDNSAWEQQLQGYGDISGAQELLIVRALCDMPETIINDYKRRLFYKMNVVSEESPEFLKAVEKLERSMRFSDIPAPKRIHKTKITPWNDFQRQQVYDRVKVCREWLAAFSEQYSIVK